LITLFSAKSASEKHYTIALMTPSLKEEVNQTLRVLSSWSYHHFSDRWRRHGRFPVVLACIIHKATD